MRTRSRLTRERLDGTVVDIEFLLIAVIQGLALTTLAVESEGVIGGEEWIYWPYVVAGFVLILNFWSLAVIHSVSFISWPFDLVHTLLYFLVSFVEVTAFTQLAHPGKWFVFMFVFFLVSFLLYAWDARMIRQREGEFRDTPARARLYDHIVHKQTVELHVVLPGALLFHGAIVVVLLLAPDLILANDRHEFVVAAQVLFGLAYLVNTIRGFAVRERLLTNCIEDDPEPTSV